MHIIRAVLELVHIMLMPLVAFALTVLATLAVAGVHAVPVDPSSMLLGGGDNPRDETLAFMGGTSCVSLCVACDSGLCPAAAILKHNVLDDLKACSPSPGLDVFCQAESVGMPM